MLSDLIQYFTNDIQIVSNEEINYTQEGYETIRFLRFIILHITSEDTRDRLLDNIDLYSADLIELGPIFDVAQSSNYHLCDWLIQEDQFTSAIWELIMITILPTECFEINYTSDNVLDIFEGDVSDIKKVPKFNMNCKVDFAIEKFILDATNNLLTSWAECEVIDEYDAEQTCISIGSITFEKRGKGVARKLRKAYYYNSQVREMMHELNISMVNGEFIMMSAFYVDGYDLFYEQMDTDVIFDGLDALMKYLKRYPIKEERKIERVFMKYILEITNNESGYYTSEKIMRRIMNVRNGEREIIL